MSSCPRKLGMEARDFSRVRLHMKTKHVVIIVLLILFGGCLFVHRRVIKALITGEPMPKAPNWHCWVPEENRRG